MQNNQWFYEINGEQKGPISEAEIILLIQSKQLNQHNKVWSQGLPNWISLIDSELKQHLDLSSPPPLRKTSPQPLSMQQTNSAGNFFELYYLNVLKNYVNFSGRATRKEYWLFQLIQFVIMFVLLIVDSAISGGLLFGLYGLATFLPSLGICVRRLHDTGRSGWWTLISFIPFVGPIVLIIFLCLDSQTGNAFDHTTGRNQYGDNPKLTRQ